MKTAKLSVLPIKDLNPAEYNPRKKLKPGDKEYEKIKHSIEEFGFADPVVVNSDMTIIGGHQRVTVAAALGYTEVPCAIVEVSKTQEKALNIALNKISGEWNQELLADLIQDLQDSDFDVGFTGFEPPEIEQLFSKVHDKKVKEDDFDVEAELKKPTVAQTGDVWLLGKHRVICGDSILPETYNILMDGRKANLVLTDPPYNVDVEETAGKIKNDNMADEDFYRFLFAAFVNMEQNMEDDASIYVFHADTEGLNFRKAFADAGFKLSGCCIWKKNALVLGRSPYQWQHEPCLFGWKKGGKHQWYSDRKQTTIWEYDRPKASKDHPTMKPIALMAYPVQNSSMMGCVVLNPFLGSGSTLMACEQTGRICYALEWGKKALFIVEDDTTLLVVADIYKKMKQYENAVFMYQKCLEHISVDENVYQFQDINGKQLYSIASNNSLGVIMFEALKGIISAYSFLREYEQAKAYLLIAKERMPQKSEWEIWEQTLPEIESANQRYIEIKEQLSQNSKKAVEQKRSVRQWALQLIQLQNNSGQLNLDENDDWDKYLEKMDEVLNQMVQAVNKDSIIYQNSRNWVNSTYTHLDADAKEFLITAETLYEIHKMSIIDFAPIIVEYCKVVEKQLRVLLGSQIPSSMHMLGQIIGVISTNNIHPYTLYLSDLRAVNQLRRNSAHTGLLVRNDADTIRNILYVNNLLNNLV